MDQIEEDDHRKRIPSLRLKVTESGVVGDSISESDYMSEIESDLARRLKQVVTHFTLAFCDFSKISLGASESSMSSSDFRFAIASPIKSSHFTNLHVSSRRRCQSI